MKAATIITAAAGAVVALLAVAGFLALDKTVLHLVTSEDETKIVQEVVSPTPGSAFSEEEVITLVEGRIGIGCTYGEVKWRAAYKGDHVWHVGAGCGDTVMPLTDPSLATYYAVWSFREGTERIIALNDRAKLYQVR